MSAIKDLIDFCTQLRNERREAWIRPIIDRIQTLTQQFQSDHSVVVSENLDLKREMLQLEQSHAKEISKLNSKIGKLESELTKAKTPKIKRASVFHAGSD